MSHDARKHSRHGQPPRSGASASPGAAPGKRPLTQPLQARAIPESAGGNSRTPLSAATDSALRSLYYPEDAVAPVQARASTADAAPRADIQSIAAEGTRGGG